MIKPTSMSDGAWALIENEKRRDRFVRRVSIAAWITTFAIVLAVAAMTSISVIDMARRAQVGIVRWTDVMGSAMPLIDVLWKLSLLVAALSTVGIFLRLRTASLTEIQLRLAALEEMVASNAASLQR